MVESKKIIFVGPSGVGKTTLRKVFFEGENAYKLLEYALKPTYGEESLILRFKDINIGIFDLAGQENRRWLESEEKSIFFDTNVILAVVDVKITIEEIMNFITKVVKIREEITPNSVIFLLIHKIDLINKNKLIEIKSKISDIIQTSLIQVFYTSIKSEYLLKTFSFFIEVMKTCLQEENIFDKLNFRLFQDILRVLRLIDKELVISKKDIQLELNLSEICVDRILEPLIRKHHIQKSNKNNHVVLSITDKGKQYNKDFIKNFSLESYNEFEKLYYDTELPTDFKVPSFIGAYIADKDGKLLLTVELFDGALQKFLTNHNEIDEERALINFELVPMFVSALEKFSYEINIQDLTKFYLKGKNITMQIFGFEKYTVTMFINPEIDIKTVENSIYNYFQNLFREYDDNFTETIKTGVLDNLTEIGLLVKKWLENLNKNYEEMVINLEVVDFEQALILYGKIDELFKDINLKFSITMEKIKKLKINLMKCILQKDIEELKKIVKYTKEIRLKYN